eukprot:352431-Chlamydomonas_euryale.AAC.7
MGQNMQPGSPAPLLARATYHGDTERLRAALVRASQGPVRGGRPGLRFARPSLRKARPCPCFARPTLTCASQGAPSPVLCKARHRPRFAKVRHQSAFSPGAYFLIPSRVYPVTTSIIDHLFSG